MTDKAALLALADKIEAADATCLCHSERLIHPRLVRAEIEARISVFHDGNATSLAHEIAVHPEQLAAYLRGSREHLEPKLAAALGYERVVMYRPRARAEECE